MARSASPSKRHAAIGAGFQHHLAQGLHAGGAAIQIDVLAVGLGGEGGHAGAQAGEKLRS